MSKLTRKIISADNKISENIDFFVKLVFEYNYPQKLKKWRGKRIVPLYDWDALYTKGVDRFFDFLPAGKTDSLPKNYCLSPREEKKLQAWYEDYSAYVYRLEHGNDLDSAV